LGSLDAAWCAVPDRRASELPPHLVARAARIHRREERVVAQLVHQLARVGEELLVREQARDGRRGVLGADVLDVAEEDRLLDRAVADHVEVQLEQLLLADEVVLGPERVQLGDPPGVLAAVEQEAQHRHEVRLAGAEAAVQERRAAALVLQRRAHDLERLVERRADRRRDHVGLGRAGGVADGLPELLDEQDAVDALGEIEE